jgi:DNA-binding MarR family transcriptional regulator
MRMTPPPTATTRRATTDGVGFLLAKASTRWNAALEAAFAARGYPDVRASYGSVLLPLFEQDGLRMGDLTLAARQPKQTTTTLIRQMERDGLVVRDRDPDDGRAWRVHLTERARAFQPVAEDVLDAMDARLSEHLTQPALEVLETALRGVIDL